MRGLTLYVKACGRTKSAIKKQRKTLGASKNKIALTAAIGETPSQDTAAKICWLVTLPDRTTCPKTRRAILRRFYAVVCLVSTRRRCRHPVRCHRSACGELLRTCAPRSAHAYRSAMRTKRKRYRRCDRWSRYPARPCPRDSIRTSRHCRRLRPS